MGPVVDPHQRGGIDVSVALRRRERRVSEKFLNGSQVGARTQQVSREGVPQRVRRDARENRSLAQATIEDPEVFTDSWTMRMPMYRRLEPNVRVLEYKCVEFAEEIVYGHLRRRDDADNEQSSE